MALAVHDAAALVAPMAPLSRHSGGMRLRSLLTFAAVGGGSGRVAATSMAADSCSTTLYDIPVSNNGARVRALPSVLPLLGRAGFVLPATPTPDIPPPSLSTCSQVPRGAVL